MASPLLLVERTEAKGADPKRPIPIFFVVFGSKPKGADPQRPSQFYFCVERVNKKNIRPSIQVCRGSQQVDCDNRIGAAVDTGAGKYRESAKGQASRGQQETGVNEIGVEPHPAYRWCHARLHECICRVCSNVARNINLNDVTHTAVAQYCCAYSGVVSLVTLLLLPVESLS